MRAEGAAGDPVRPELCRRRGARPADRGDARGRRRRGRRAIWRTRSTAGTFRPYHSTDVRGVELGGAAKNVLAIAAGIVTGRGLGASAAAALITRGFAELARFGRAFGAKPETLTGLSGLGDLILTCSSPQSRNFSFGVALGKGETPDSAAHGKLAEGAFTAPVLLEMAREEECRHADRGGGRGGAGGKMSVDAGDRVAADAADQGGGVKHGLLADEIRARLLVVGATRSRAAPRAKPGPACATSRPSQSHEDEKRRPRLLLSLRRRQGGRRHRRDRPRSTIPIRPRRKASPGWWSTSRPSRRRPSR